MLRRLKDMRAFHRCTTTPLFVLAVAACGPAKDAGPDVRGGGNPVARVSAAERGGIYGAALRQAFDANEALVLLVDPAVLPRHGGLARDQRLSDAMLRSLRADPMVNGVCEPSRPEPDRAPICTGNRAGYVVRVSDVFRRAGDTLRLFVAVERFRTPSVNVGRFAFEDGYELVRDGRSWRVARKARRTIK